MEFSCDGNDLLPLASLLAPENCRYHAASKGFRTFTNPLALPFGGQPHVAHGVGVPSDQITIELSMSLRDGTAANQISWF